MRFQPHLLIVVLSSSLGSCGYDESQHITHRDIRGKVRIPKELVVLEIADSEGNITTLAEDIRLLGPVYIGVYASIRDGLYPYPHPEIGPVLTEGEDGNAYPYGGTTIGRFDWGCYEAMKCKLVTGRYGDYQSVVDFFGTELERPILNDLGEEVGSGVELRERCYEIQFLTGDSEVQFVGPLDFKEEGDFYVAEVEILHTDWRKGVSVWGWMDMPNASFDFATCDPDAGDRITYYDDDYLVGTQYGNLLNFPGLYIGAGDVVSADPAIINNPDAEFSLTLGMKVDE